MCGIAGILGEPDSTGEFACRVSVEAMNRAQSHRGPDDQGFWPPDGQAADTPVVLGHRRLSIIDLSADGHQPMVDATPAACWSSTVRFITSKPCAAS
jgi:asparagine synthase (glutamine-hydrolysing)